MDPQSDADKIRLKRLEKLQAAQSASQADGQPQAGPSGTANGASSSPSASRTVTPASLATPPSAVKRSETPSFTTAAPAKKPSLSSSSSTPAARSGASTPATATSKPVAPATSSAALTASLKIPFPQWFSGVVSRIFLITLSEARAESSNWSITYLYTLHAELVEEANGMETEATVRYDEDNLERAIVARLSLDPDDMSEAGDDPVKVTVLAALPSKMTNLEYLISCWKRWPAERAKFAQAKDMQEDVAKRIQALDFIKRKLIEGIGLQLQEPSLFPQPSGKPLGGIELVPILLQTPAASTSSVSLETHQALSLLVDIASVYATPTSSSDLVDVIGTPILQAVIDRLGAKQGSIQAMVAAMGGQVPGSSGVLDLTTMEWRNVARAVNDLTENKAIANMFVDMPNWNPADAPANTFELESLLGPLLRLGCFPDAFPNVCKAYFAQPSALSREAIEASSNALRSTIASLQQLLFSIFNSIVRASGTSREGVLSYFAQAIKINHRRDGMRVDRRTVSSDGFMINNLSLLMDFSKPFMDASFSKIDKIDPEYFKKCKGRLDIKEITKLHADAEEARAYYNDYEADPNASPPNFISEIFFLSAAFMHYALYPATQYHEALYRHLRNRKEDLQDLEANRQYDGTPQEPAYRGQVEGMKKQLDALHSRILASEVHLLDPAFIARCASHTSFVMTWLVRLVDPKGQHPRQMISLDNLPSETPLAFKMLPEYLIEDVTEFYFFTSRYAPQTMIDMDKDQLVVFLIVFLYTPYLRNPYLKGHLVEVLYRNTRSWGSRFPRGTMGDIINFHPLALKGLLPALMHVYSEIEFTGQHNQFYEKFEVRHHIAKILRLMWDTKDHREAFRAEAGKEDFVKFVNYLLNDTTFLLDESLSKLKLIHDIQLEMADKATWDAQPEEQRKDREKLFKQSEGQASSFLVYTYEDLHLLKTLTAEAPDPFLKGEIVDRLAASLDFNLNVLAGPRCQELRVQDKEKYHFRPRELLGDIMQVIINLAAKERYMVATAKDGRSYSKNLFDNATRIAARAGLKSEMQLQVLRTMVNKIEELQAAEAEEEEMGETPDEYLDPLTAEIMLDPVTLPTSGTVVDFNTIKQHLLTVPQDPFNRSPLKLEDIKRNDSLREEIEAFRAKRRQERLERLQAQKTAAAAEEPQAMDQD